ncbi:NAD-dependent epimerase/dehydratase family protein [Leadbettera azotonutricia]|uniref:NAD-dependent epimerase/dehydratase n=1 Tax=Leadbettera azotonutricia (strain ATCC BAA-888 / DSM 13862 / ZAS-9) TaxID=545695 RepID=F5YA82_LEAAZ|nr:NAD(P)-dependent oxidoreductase [Leadbettera azotonutricia]AEF80972.1 NAD-dependent epimerase/dehydratase [Leadbettera azotonutricia ZAS-9]
MKRVTITGAAGLLGPYVVQHFVEQGYDVLSTDIKKPEKPLSRFMFADLNNLGECYDVLESADAVIHLAAIPAAYMFPNDVTFRNNTVAAYNILEAAAGRGIKKAVIASSECIYGVVTTRKGLTPAYVPMDEEHPILPEDAYSLSKICSEAISDTMYRRKGMQVVSFRLGNVISKEKYLNFPNFIHNPKERFMILWSYIDARDIATACRLAIEKDGLGSVKLNLAADETSMDITTGELLKAEFPTVTDIRCPVDGYHTLLSNEKAKKVLGWKPVHHWRDNVPKV